jgi:hypothetical protein
MKKKKSGEEQNYKTEYSTQASMEEKLGAG